MTHLLLITILTAVVLCAIAMALLSVRVLLKKGGQFRMGHACRFDAEARRRALKAKSEQNKSKI